MVGDLATVRERCTIGDGVVIGRGVCVENDTAIGSRTKIQSNAYITAYCTLEEDVFIAPCVITTNDNFMGRTERRHELVQGADHPPRRPASAAAPRCCPGWRSARRRSWAPARSCCATCRRARWSSGAPARVLRDVPADELLGAQ